ncbi:hypothetical protein KCG44_12360 [Pacificimonas sp. WHA3]|uniref:O-antigen polymerase n=1 Tax=Pacificimonas pallii TaxID=2827236 RepID=A0ABS6SGP8_9SPHN|nr:hypothetical protein [Pacificimonas pallii]MBV7257577.1 hypothetical protein [Pacificimonas pallii]
MLTNYKLRSSLRHILIAYLFSILFFYPYGFAVSGDNYLRISDFFAVLSFFVGIVIIMKRGSIYRYPVFELLVLPLAVCEIIYPMLSIPGLGAGLSGLGNSLRMILLWGPALVLIWSTSNRDFSLYDSSVWKLFTFALLANLFYGFVQMLYAIGIAPATLIFTSHLERFAVDSHFRIIDYIRAAGFFGNTSGLAAFAMICQSYFFARFISRNTTTDLYLGLISAILSVMTLSRASMVGTLLILTFLWLRLDLRKKFISVVAFLVFMIPFLFLIDEYVGIDLLFHRYEVFFELGASGVLSDSSFSLRFYEFWPRVIEKLDAYPLGTLSSPGEKIGLIDSGYLTYYAQGRMPFLLASIILPLGLIMIGTSSFLKKRNEGSIQLGFISLYILGAMVVSIPLRYPFIVFFIVYACWNHSKINLYSSTAKKIVSK